MEQFKLAILERVVEHVTNGNIEEANFIVSKMHESVLELKEAYTIHFRMFLQYLTYYVNPTEHITRAEAFSHSLANIYNIKINSNGQSIIDVFQHIVI